MSTTNIAYLWDGREIDNEMEDIDESNLKDDGIVVVFGYSDDNIEFRGAIHEEIGAYGGRTIRVTRYGIVENKCDNEDCPYFDPEQGQEINAEWNVKGFSWYISTDIPHESFVIYEDGETFCRGIVFSLKDVK